MTQLQTRETAQTPSEPVSPPEQGSKRTGFVVVGVLALLAAAFGVAMWANSDTESSTQAETSSVEIVQNEIDKALAQAQAEPSSVAIVQNEIDKALAGSEAEQIAASDDAAAFGERGSGLPPATAQRLPYWPYEAERNLDLAEAQTVQSPFEIEAALESRQVRFSESNVDPRQWNPDGFLGYLERTNAEPDQWTPYWVVESLERSASN